MQTRRQFIHRTLAAGAGLVWTAGCGPRLDEIRGLEPAAIDALRRNFTGEVITPDDPRSETVRHVIWRNPSTDLRPAVVARCSGTDDVVRSLELADRSGVPLAVRGGGHNFLGWSTCHGGIVVDTSAMNAVAVDAASGTMRAGAGALSQALVEAASPHGLAPALGECPSVGIAGLTLGGGLGWLSGTSGATCDTLISAELVAASGEIVRVSATENPDLFWAIRGGGGNFGVATAFTYRLQTVSNVLAGRLWYRAADAYAVLRVFAEVMAEAPDPLQARALVANRGEEPFVFVELCWSGPEADGQPFVRTLRSAAMVADDTVSWQGYNAFARGTATAAARPFSAVKGAYVRPVSPEAIEVLLDAFHRAPAPEPVVGLDHYMHGEVCRVDPASTAFGLRAPDAVHVFALARWSDPETTPAVEQWIEEARLALQPFSGGRIYANYPGAEGQDASRAVYEQNYARLARVKYRYDPGNLLRGNYNVQPEASS